MLFRVRASLSVEESTTFTAHSRATNQSLTTWRVWRLRRRSTKSDGFLSRMQPTSCCPPTVSQIHQVTAVAHMKACCLILKSCSSCTTAITGTHTHLWKNIHTCKQQITGEASSRLPPSCMAATEYQELGGADGRGSYFSDTNINSRNKKKRGKHHLPPLDLENEMLLVFV